jgi:hypothetical protein
MNQFVNTARCAVAGFVGLFATHLAAPAHAGDEIIFLDPGVHDAHVLERAGHGAALVRLDPARDPISQIAAELQSRDPVSSVHILSHGGPGELRFSNVTLDAEGLRARSDALAAIDAALGAGADLRLYACSAAMGEKGAALTDALSGVLSADLALSSTRTGAAASGGDWALEWTRGDLEPSAATRAFATSGYSGTLSFTLPGTLDFSFITMFQFTGSNVATYGDVRFTYTSTDAMADWAELPDSGSANSESISAFYGTNGSGVETVTLESVDGSEFDLDSFWHDANSYTVITSVEGWRDGAQVATQTTGLGGTTITLGSGFDNVDEVRIISNADGFGSEFDDFVFAATADTTAPRVTSIVRQTPAAATTNANTLVFRVTFDEDVQNVNAADFNASGTSGDATSVSTVNASTYDVTVSGGDLASYDGAVGLTFDGAQNIEDLANNALSNTTPTGANESYTLDNTAPSLAEVTPVTTPTADSTPSYTFSTNEAGTLAVGGSCGSLDEGAVASGNNTITLTDTDNSSALADATYSDCTVTVTDAVGNASTPLSITSFTVDTAAPVVQSIALQGSPAANAASVTYRVTFNENANLVSTDDFALTTTGGASGNIASVSAASGTTIDVVVDTLAGDGTIRLDLQGATNIDDDLDNTPPGAFTSGGVHTVNRAAPTVTAGNISISGASGTGGAFIIGDTVTASWDNTGTGDNNSDIASVTVDFTQFGGGAAVAASNSSDTWTATYTITAGAIDATNRNVSVTATDTGGNDTTTADTTNATVDNQAPTVTDGAISISGASGAGGAFITGDTVTATWNNTAGGDNNADTIAGVTVDFTEFGGGAAVAASNSMDTWTATHTITAGSANGANRNVSVTATDNAGNVTTTADTTNATVDTGAPSVTSVSVPANNTYVAGENLDFTVNFDEAVTVNTGGGTPQIAITVGSTTRQAQFVSGGGTAALLFRYTVQVGDNDADGIAVGALSANGGTLRDGVGNDADLTLNSVGATGGVLVDTTAPTGYSVSFDDTVYDATETGAVSFTMAMAEIGTSLDYTISSNNGGAPVTGNVASVASAAEQVTGIDVSGLNDGTLTVSVTLTDAGGNAGAAVTDTATLSASPPAFSKLFAPDSIVLNGTSTLTFTIDNSAVAVTSSALDFTDNFPAGMTVATPANAATTCTGGTLTAVSGAGVVSYTGGSIAAGASCTVSVDVTGATPGGLVNTSGDLTSSQGNSGAAADTLTVIQSTFSIADVTVDEDAGTATFTVTMSTPPVTAASVDYATSDGTATAGADYTATSGTLNFAIGDDSESFTVDIADDTLDEAATETFSVTLSAPVNATIADGSATGTINDNDSAPAISIADVTVMEDAGSASFTVSLSNPSVSTVMVDFATADGTALAGSDYDATSGTLTFAPGDTSETVTVTITDDAVNEAAEGFTVDLSAPTNATLADATGDGTITDDDAAPTLSIADAAVDEGAGTASFTVSLSAASGQTVMGAGTASWISRPRTGRRWRDQTMTRPPAR